MHPCPQPSTTFHKSLQQASLPQFTGIPSIASVAVAASPVSFYGVLEAGAHAIHRVAEAVAPAITDTVAGGTPVAVQAAVANISAPVPAGVALALARARKIVATGTRWGCRLIAGVAILGVASAVGPIPAGVACAAAVAQTAIVAPPVPEAEITSLAAWARHVAVQCGESGVAVAFLRERGRLRLRLRLSI